MKNGVKLRDEENIAIFTAGVSGQKLMKKMKNAHVVCFIDNDVSKQGTRIAGVPVVSLDDYKRKMKSAKVIIPDYQYLTALAAQLDKAGITEWEFRNHDFDPAYPENVLVINPYKNRHDVNGTEEQHNKDTLKNTPLIAGQMAYAKHLTKANFSRCSSKTARRMEKY